MQVAENKFVALDYTLTLASGEVVDRSEPGSPLSFICGAGRIIPGLERQLVGLDQGASARITVDAEEAYGVREPELVQTLPRGAFPSDLELKAGMSLNVRGPHGPVRLTVTEIRAEDVVIDLNHPLAGERLFFDVHIAEVREPTEEELGELNGCSEEDCGCCGGGCG